MFWRFVPLKDTLLVCYNKCSIWQARLLALCLEQKRRENPWANDCKQGIPSPLFVMIPPTSRKNLFMSWPREKNPLL